MSDVESTKAPPYGLPPPSPPYQKISENYRRLERDTQARSKTNLIEFILTAN